MSDSDHLWDEELLRRQGAPRNEIPGVVPLNRTLVRTDDVVLALLRLQVYSTGLTMELAVGARPTAERRDRRLHRELSADPRRSRGALLVGVELADGRRVISRTGDLIDIGVVLRPAGSWSGGSMSRTWWLSPLPPTGPLTVVISCADLGIEETSTVISGELIERAAADVVTLWAWQGYELMQYASPAHPDLPPGSWFAES
jgi:hypothetical protein